MKPTKFSNVKKYYKLKPSDINRTNINSPEDKYQDKVLENLEKKSKPSKPIKKKPKTFTYHDIIKLFEDNRLPLTKNQRELINHLIREEWKNQSC